MPSFEQIGATPSNSMKSQPCYLTAAPVLLLAFTLSMQAQTAITIHVKNRVRRIDAIYKCDVTGVSLGLPSGRFRVRYLTAGDNSLAVIPVNGRDLIFAQVLSADGGRYVAGRFQWWDGRETTFTKDPDAIHTPYATCKSMNVK